MLSGQCGGGRMTETASAAQIRKASGIPARTLARERQHGIIVPVSAVVREVSCSLADR